MHRPAPAPREHSYTRGWFVMRLTGNAKLAGFSLTVTAIISLVAMTALHAVLPGA